MDLNHDWCLSEFETHESLTPYRPIEDELAFYTAVAAGNHQVVDNLSQKLINYIPPEGIYSDDALQDIRYHFAIVGSGIAKFCVHNGMEQDRAYSMSRFYIKKMDTLNTKEDIDELFLNMVNTFCQQMEDFQKKASYSKPIVLCMDYIYSHLHYRITVKELSEYLNLSESYLSKLFHKEVGITLSQYIMNLKIEKAQNLLQYSDYSMVDIANYLSFSSQSHFIQSFQKTLGTTPHKFRTQNFRSSWK